MKVTALITNYNSSELTRRCVGSCLELESNLLQSVIVVDDASTEPLELAENSLVHVIRNEGNLGLVRSLNVGMKATDSDIVVIFDADAYPLAPFVEKVSDYFASDPLLAALAFRTVETQGRPTASSEREPRQASLLLGQALHARWSSFAGRLGMLPRGLCIYTCAMAIRRSIFEQLGGFDEAFDWLDFDNDLSMRINRSKYSLFVADDLLAYHVGSGTFQKPSARVLRHYKNRWLLLTKFNLIKNKGLIRSVVLCRLQAELLILRGFGPVIHIPKDSLLDKIEGRQAIISMVKECYR